MKRIISAVLLVLSLFVSACGAALPETRESAPAGDLPIPAGNAPQTEVEGLPLPVITPPVTRADLEAIPVADPSMTEDELRASCVRYMRLEKEVVWTVNADAAYPCDWAGAADSSGNMHLTRGVIYRGMPYTGAHLDLACFFDVVDEKTGVLDTASLGAGYAVSTLIGNTCNTSCFWAWQRVCASFNFAWISNMTESNGCIPIGPYETSGLPFSGNNDTSDICTRNGEQVMYESYACFKPASGMLTKKDENVGHVRMVQEAPVVVRRADGTIDGAASYVICLEQGSSLKPAQTEFGAASQFVGEFRKFNFASLYSTNYIPFDFAELLGRATVQKASVTLGEEAPADYKTLTGLTLRSNYGVSRADAKIFDASGKEIYSYGVMNDVRSYNNVHLSRLFHVRLLREAGMKEGESYRFTVTARLANGETLTAFDGSVVF